METKQSKSSIAALIFLAFIWGSSFILMKRGLEAFNANQVAAIRIFLSFIVLLPFAILRLKFLNLRLLFFVALSGFLGSGIPAFLFTSAQVHINSTMAGILNSLTPLFTLIIAILFFKTKVYWFNVIGIILGFIGAAALLITDFTIIFKGENIYGLLIVFATLLYGFNTNHVKNNLKELDGMSITALSFFTVGPFTGVYLLFSDLPTAFEKPGAWSAFGYITILAVIGTAFALIIMNILIKRLTAIFASSVTYIIPVFAIGWGILDGEIFSWHQGLSIILIFTGIYLVNKRAIKQHYATGFTDNADLKC
ncbi:MAG: EamA family transporter [Bacteroidetes bacterium CG02_land_8_20_14_3_00_31_25]|nr:DMT family transporter [Bacteroidota bacterium]PIV57553.1 MAG: EamA family transporter [Bacteroidetes bacterium CG02_land_8_20_14_3_00_31_25]PIX33669.1 MAG: EamA family transporter [Bacteroidetes bacterium CG_4_8_14_3_um_filter_31_14]PIY04217.1 MAG: EamA family transporter [Bacteroidetes bacterium CG_4_10_14_3_um_filter_31_20]